MPLSQLTFGFLLTAAYWPGIVAAAVAPRWAVVMVGAPALLLLAPYYELLPAMRRYAFFAFLFLAYLSATLLWAPDPQIGFGSLLHFAALTVVALLGATLYDVRPILLGAIFGLIPSILVIPFQYYYGFYPAGLFFNPNVLAEIAAPLLMYSLLSVGMRIAIIPTLVLINAIDRTAILALTVATFLLLPLGWRWRAALAAAGGIAIATLTYISQWGVASLDTRWVLWAATLDMRPWGHGLGSYMALHPLLDYAHNDFLQLCYEIGIIGTLPIIAILTYAVANNEPELKAERAALVVLLVESLFSFSLFLPASGALLALLLGNMAAHGDYTRVLVSRGRVAFADRA